MFDPFDSTFQLRLVAIFAVVLISMLVYDFLNVRKWNKIAFTPVKELDKYYAVVVGDQDPIEIVRFWSGNDLSLARPYLIGTIRWASVQAVQVCLTETGQPIYSIKKGPTGTKEEFNTALLMKEMM